MITKKGPSLAFVIMLCNSYQGPDKHPSADDLYYVNLGPYRGRIAQIVHILPPTYKAACKERAILVKIEGKSGLLVCEEELGELLTP